MSNFGDTEKKAREAREEYERYAAGMFPDAEWVKMLFNIPVKLGKLALVFPRFGWKHRQKIGNAACVGGRAFAGAGCAVGRGVKYLARKAHIIS